MVQFVALKSLSLFVAYVMLALPLFEDSPHIVHIVQLVLNSAFTYDQLEQMNMVPLNECKHISTSTNLQQDMIHITPCSVMAHSSVERLPSEVNTRSSVAVLAYIHCACKFDMQQGSQVALCQKCCLNCSLCSCSSFCEFTVAWFLTIGAGKVQGFHCCSRSDSLSSPV